MLVKLKNSQKMLQSMLPIINKSSKYVVKIIENRQRLPRIANGKE